LVITWEISIRSTMIQIEPFAFYLSVLTNIIKV